MTSSNKQIRLVLITEHGHYIYNFLLKLQAVWNRNIFCPDIVVHLSVSIFVFLRYWYLNLIGRDYSRILCECFLFPNRWNLFRYWYMIMLILVYLIWYTARSILPVDVTVRCYISISERSKHVVFDWPMNFKEFEANIGRKIRRLRFNSHGVPDHLTGHSV